MVLGLGLGIKVRASVFKFFMGLTIWGFGFKVPKGLGFKVRGLGLRVEALMV